MKNLLLLAATALIIFPGFSQCLTTKLIKSDKAYFDIFTIPCISFSHDSRFFCYSEAIGTINICNISQNKTSTYTLAKESTVVTYTFHPKKELIAIGCKDGSVTLFDYVNSKVIKTIQAHTKSVTAASWSSTGDTLYTAGKEDVLSAWNDKGELLKTFVTASSAKTICVRGNKLIYNNEKSKNCVRIIDFVSAAEKIIPAKVAYKMDVTPDGKKAYVGMMGQIEIWDLESGLMEKIIPGEKSLKIVYGVSISNDCKWLVYGGEEKKLIVMDNSNQQVCMIDNVPDVIYAASLSPDKKLIAVLTNEQKMHIYSLSKDGKYIQTVKDADGGIYTGNIVDGKKQDMAGDSATYTWPDGRKYVGRFQADKMVEGTVYFPNGKKEVYKLDFYDGSIDIAFYMRITENEGMGSYVKKDILVFARVFRIPVQYATPESVLEAAQKIAEAQLEGKNATYVTHQKANKGEDYESFKKRLIEKDGLQWQGASGNYFDFAK